MSAGKAGVLSLQVMRGRTDEETNVRTDRVIDAMTTIVAESHLLRIDVEEDPALTHDDRDTLLQAALVIRAHADAILDWLITSPLETPRQ